MKAAHRKELQTNALADKMGRLYENVKSGPKSASAIVWILGVLVLVVLLAWRYFGSSSVADDSMRWLALRAATTDAATMPSNLEKFVEADKGTVQARIARFQLARWNLREGQDLFASERREVAVKNLRTARDLYDQLARETSYLPMLHQETLMGAAKAEEALAGTPGELADGMAGSLERALDYYLKLVQFNLTQIAKPAGRDQAVAALEQLVSQQVKDLGSTCEPDQALTAYQRLVDYSPDKFKGEALKWRDLTYLGRSAAIRAKEIQQQPKAVEAFYADLNKIATPKPLLDPKQP